MDRASSSPAGATPPDLDGLLDALTISRTILASLQEGPQESNTPRQITETKKDIARLQNEVKRARGDPKASKGAANPNSAMQWSRSDDYGGPSSYSNSGNLTPASASTAGSAFGQKKRTFGAHLDDDASSGSRVKSRRTTPSPQQTANTTPSVGDDFWGDDSSVIDLTGDDADLEQLFEQQKAAFAQVEQARADERLARSLQHELQDNPFSNSSPVSPAPPGPTAFDWILGRPSQSSQGQPQPPSSQERNPFRLNNAYPAGQSQPQSRMPGSFDFDVETHFDPPAHPVPSQSVGTYSAPSYGPSNASLPSMGPPNTGFSTMGVSPFSSPLPGNNYAPDISAAESARQAALSRQQGYLSSGGYGTTGNGVVLPGLISANRFAGYAGGVSQLASLGNRPGTLNSGAYAPLQTRGANISPYSAASSQVPTGGYLPDIINLTTDIDWANGLDALGNPLSANLRSYYEDLHDDPRKTTEEINDLLANIRPDEDIPKEDRIGTPEQLRYALYAHQQLALQWMMDSEKGKNQGGILADDMGLGKTISALALMVSRPSPDNRNKTNLIVGPVALLKQWEVEIKKKLKPNHRLSVLLLHNKSMTYEDIRSYDVVLTSYGKVGAEQKRFEAWIAQHPGARPDRDAQLARICPLLHPNSKFYRVILDEAQCIKNDKTLQARGSCSLRGIHRWCLTGTPMMNGIHELFSLIKFLKIKPYHEQKEFNKTFGSLTPRTSRGRSAGENTKTKAMDALRVLLKAIMLRRMKSSTLDGKPLVTLPPKTEEVAHVEFSEDERQFYTDLESKTRITFNKYLRAGTVGKNYSNILVLLLRLRQACCHPHLNLDVEYVGNSEVTERDMDALAKTLAPDVIARLKAQNEEGFKCPICFDAVIDPTIVLPCGHNTCTECFTTLAERAVDNSIREGVEGSAFKCPECRGAVNPKKVINLTSFKAVHMLETTAVNEDDIETASEGSSTEDDSSESDSGSDDDPDDADEVDGNGNLKGFIVVNDDEEEPAEDNDDGDDLSISQSANNASKTPIRAKKSKRKSKGKSKAKGKAKSKGKGKAKGKAKEKKEEIKPHMLKSLRTEARKNKSEYKRYMKYLRKNWMPSAKVSECCKILESVRESGDKTIVFSQFTFLLDLLEIPIKFDLGLGYCRYDGGMSRAHRDAAAQDFQDPNSRTKVLLISLKAGNAGLNLTAANHVIVMDPFWNPYIEMQAVDRAYRIGQQKPVKVHRLLVEGTVEDRIADLQEQKRKFVDAALDEGESKNLGRLSTRDLQRLFNGD
ncbi:SNF2 family N-terminal domain-containing protein [Diaporthe sp. PMI_573]|nr:SNF2 family N-terminal domain-containing protein [Diaporthaceae sp. PMI_573]